MTWPAAADAAVVHSFAERHVVAFNAAVAAADFTGFLGRFADDAVLTFENVPGAGRLEFAGRAAYTAAYSRQPPDDELDIAGTVTVDGGWIVIPSPGGATVTAAPCA